MLNDSAFFKFMHLTEDENIIQSTFAIMTPFDSPEEADIIGYHCSGSLSKDLIYLKIMTKSKF